MTMGLAFVMMDAPTVAMRRERANARCHVPMAAMRPAKYVAWIPAKVDATRAGGVSARRDVPMAAMSAAKPAVITNAKMAAISMGLVYALATANTVATTMALARPTPLDARMATIKIAAIACVLTTAQMAVTKKVKHAIARYHAQTAVTRPGRIVSVSQAVPNYPHATPKQADAHALKHVPMDAKMMAHATKHVKPYSAKAKMNNVKTAHV